MFNNNVLTGLLLIIALIIVYKSQWEIEKLHREIQSQNAYIEKIEEGWDDCQVQLVQWQKYTLELDSILKITNSYH